MLLEKLLLTNFGQAYGTDAYGTETYACAPGVTDCQTTTAAPNTGFFGSPDAALSTAAGALLVTVALVGIVYVIIARVKHTRVNKSK